MLRSRLNPRPRVAPMPIEGPAVEKVHGVGSIAAGVVPSTSRTGRRRFPQWHHSAGDG